MGWRKFIPALVLSIAIAKPPLVALGAGVFEGGRILLGLSLLGMFILAMITAWVKRKSD